MTLLNRAIEREVLFKKNFPDVREAKHLEQHGDFKSSEYSVDMFLSIQRKNACAPYSRTMGVGFTVRLQGQKGCTIKTRRDPDLPTLFFGPACKMTLRCVQETMEMKNIGVKKKGTLEHFHTACETSTA